jgi:hypothetical protein
MSRISTMTTKIGIGVIAAAAVLASANAVSAAPHGWRNHPASQGWRWSVHDHMWYQETPPVYFHRAHPWYHNDRNAMHYSYRNNTWYYRPNRFDRSDHPYSQGWRWSVHDRMWYQVR